MKLYSKNLLWRLFNYTPLPNKFISIWVRLFLFAFVFSKFWRIVGVSSQISRSEAAIRGTPSKPTSSTFTYLSPRLHHLHDLRKVAAKKDSTKIWLEIWVMSKRSFSVSFKKTEFSNNTIYREGIIIQDFCGIFRGSFADKIISSAKVENPQFYRRNKVLNTKIAICVQNMKWDIQKVEYFPKYCWVLHKRNR